ncbi:MAG: glutamate--cysteine ligase [Chloroflexota bacterium]|nr:glutamate--cysteine ligase [Chloroflexota bacterium]
MSPSTERQLDEALLLQQLRDHTFAPSAGAPQVGLEVEELAFRGVQAVPLANVLAAVEPLVSLKELAESTTPGGLPCFEYGQIHLTFEPGGQLEIVSPPRLSAAEALTDISKLEQLLDRVFVWHGIRRANHGMNPWQSTAEIALETPLPRYEAMQQYFGRIGPDGLRMMRLSCALQINLDSGTMGEVPRRWLLANLMSPILIGVFANSPIAEGHITGWKSERARVVHHMDPSRVGPLAGADPPAEYLQFALDAGVLLIRTPLGTVPGRAGWTFRHWMREGSAWGYPTLDDWRYHLTTLFPQVRPRGFLEMRAIDAPPIRWRAVPVAVATALLLDESARETALALLEPLAGELEALTLRAAHDGPADPLVGLLARRLMELAIESLPRLPVGWLSTAIESDLQAFHDIYTARGRCPADELLDLQIDRTPTEEHAPLGTAEGQ